MLKTILIGVALVAVAGAVYVRLSPTDLASYHIAPLATEAGDTAGRNAFKAARRITTPPVDIMRAVDAVATAADRTKVVAGSAAEGLVTYETRSALMGYPDYTTVTTVDGPDGPLLVIRGQSRFGASDLGANRARIEGWLAQLGPLVSPAS